MDRRFAVQQFPAEVVIFEVSTGAHSDFASAWEKAKGLAGWPATETKGLRPEPIKARAATNGPPCVTKETVHETADPKEPSPAQPVGDGDQIIEALLAAFDFEAVHAYMRDRKTPSGRSKPWTWQDEKEAPSVARLIRTAASCLRQALQTREAGRPGHCETGGFAARWEGETEARLLFDGKPWLKAKSTADRIQAEVDELIRKRREARR